MTMYILYEYHESHMFFHALTFVGIPGKLIEHKAVRTSVQTSSEGPGKCYCNETNMCDFNSNLH